MSYYNSFIDREAYKEMSADQKRRLDDALVYAREHNLVISVRMDRFLDEEGDPEWLYSGYSYLTEGEYRSYKNSGGEWDYVYPTLKRVLRGGE